MTYGLFLSFLRKKRRFLYSSLFVPFYIFQYTSRLFLEAKYRPWYGFYRLVSELENSD